MKESDLYPRVVQWSTIDNCFIGALPGLTDGGCHGDDAAAVFEELGQIAEEIVELYKEDGKPLPVPRDLLGLYYEEPLSGAA